MAQFDLETGTIIVNLSGGALPETGGAQLEDIQGYLMNDVLDEARPIHPASGVEFRYNGRRFEEQYPRDALSVAPRLPRNAITGPVVVSAGHGWYFRHGYKDWRAQREPSHVQGVPGRGRAIGKVMQEACIGHGGRIGQCDGKKVYWTAMNAS
jgi:hypothetical protein